MCLISSCQASNMACYLLVDLTTLQSCDFRIYMYINFKLNGYILTQVQKVHAHVKNDTIVDPFHLMVLCLCVMHLALCADIRNVQYTDCFYAPFCCAGPHNKCAPSLPTRGCQGSSGPEPKITTCFTASPSQTAVLLVAVLWGLIGTMTVSL